MASNQVEAPDRERVALEPTIFAGAWYTPMVGEILVATSGYSYDDWIGPVYPKGTDRRDFLSVYAERFPFTELNFTYYREPTAGGIRQIVAKAPPEFRFVIKAHRSLTHERAPGWAASADRFLSALAGFATEPADGDDDQGSGRARDRLIGVLLQFPYSFHYTRENRRYLASVTEALRPARLFAEFRNDEWERQSVWTELERRNIGLVIPDLPRLDRLPRTAPRLTSDHGYVRLHGRNEENWWGGSNVTRYDYRYTQGQLAEWVEPVRNMASEALAVIVAFNNHFAGQAVANAEEFMELLGLVA